MWALMLGVFLIFFILPVTALEPFTLVKGSGSAVYYVAADGLRYVFPNQAIFETWYPSGKKPLMQTLSNSALAKIPLGKNILFRPGTVLVKITTDPRVYAVSRFGVLHWITSEAIARQLYGTTWNKLVRDVPDVFFTDYNIGSPIHKPSDYSPSSEQNTTKTVQDNLPSMPIAGNGQMTADQKRRAEQITSVFENGTPILDYAWIDNIDDGRGYTGGRAGFTTATGDAYLVVQRYMDRVPNNPFAIYLPELKRLAENEDSNTSNLSGFTDTWRKAAQDPVFRAVQDQVVDELYYQPAMEVADDLGIKTAIGLAILYDTIIQHGGGTDPDSLEAIVNRTKQTAGGSPASGVNELVWLNTFLDTRKTDLLNATDIETRTAWAASAGRVDVLRAVLQSGNTDLHGPIQITIEPYQARIN